MGVKKVTLRLVMGRKARSRKMGSKTARMMRRGRILARWKLDRKSKVKHNLWAEEKLFRQSFAGRQVEERSYAAVEPMIPCANHLNLAPRNVPIRKEQNVMVMNAQPPRVGSVSRETTSKVNRVAREATNIHDQLNFTRKKQSTYQFQLPLRTLPRLLQA